MSNDKTPLPRVWTAPGGWRICVELRGITHMMKPFEADALFLSLGRELDSGNVTGWFPIPMKERQARR